jgi:hypothetical protein
VSLVVSHGAEPDPQQPGRWESYLFLNDSVIVLAKTEPDNWSTGMQIDWSATGGKPVTGSGHGFRIPRNEIRDYRVTASLGGVSRTLKISVTTLVQLEGNGQTGDKQGIPERPLGTGRMINIYGEHETDDLGFDDYAVMRLYQKGAKDMRPLTRAPITTRPPDGPGLRNDCASDICLRSCPFPSPTYHAVQRIRSKIRCRMTYYESSQAHTQDFLDAFPDASHLQHWVVDGMHMDVIEYPRRYVWSAASNLPTARIPEPAMAPGHRPVSTEEQGFL